MFFQFNLNLL